jgi:predicted ATP-grasp superfamily ATP-dependent carboligase
LTKVLICGVSTRAVAESAARAGFDVAAVDAFGDLDQHPAVDSIALPANGSRPFSARAAVDAARAVAADAAVYLSPFENHPKQVQRLGERTALWGNRPDVLTRARNPFLVAQALRAAGLPTPDVRSSTNAPNRSDDDSTWLRKPLHSGGGHRVESWPRTTVPRGYYLQRFIRGVPGSIVFVAAGRDVVPLGVSRQLIGDQAFGAAGFRYCGSILAQAGDPQFSGDEPLIDAMVAAARAMTAAFGLVGVNGIDFIASGDVAYAIEINPRWCSSMDLVEQAYAVSIFELHARACADLALPEFDMRAARRRGRAVGKAIVFARQRVEARATDRWLADATVRDVPRPGARIDAGGPVCTVYASGRDSADCHAALARRARAISDEMDHWS